MIVNIFKYLLLISCFVGFIASQSQCRFAKSYSSDDLLNSQYAREQFVNDVLFWEGNFNSDGAGINMATGYTYDGHGIEYTTGQLAPGLLHNFSAPSKESIHLGVIARALSGFSKSGDFDILQFFHSSVNQTEEETRAFPQSSDQRWNNMITILYRKIATYEKFNQTFPGYGGFHPWVSVDDSGISPIPGYWTGRVPGLDNGEMIWSLYAVYNQLYTLGYDDLAARYEAYFLYLAKTAKLVFYQKPGWITSVTHIVDIYAEPTADNYYNDCDCFLDDPYEGELLTVFMDLFCQWDNITERDQLWINKRPLLQSVDFTTPQGNITVQRGWWFSSHEQWKYFMLPYQLVPVNNEIFLNGERARTWFSNMEKYPGLFASVTNVSEPNQSPNYVSAFGVQPIAFEQIASNQVVTPYASFPVSLADPVLGLNWYYNMLSAPSMQGPYGSTEAVSIDGDLISPVLTWDSKITGVLGLLGGISDINNEFLTKSNQIDRFFEVINREWTLVFPNPQGSNIPILSLQIPPIPSNLPDFTDCTYKEDSSSN